MDASVQPWSAVARTDSYWGRNATTIFWLSVLILGPLWTVHASLEVAGQYRRGYWAENEYAVDAAISTYLVVGCVVLFALSNRWRRLGMGWRTFALALALQGGVVCAGQGIIQRTYASVVSGSVVRAQSVVDAIHAYEVARGHAPVELVELAPEFLPRDPTWLYDAGPVLHYAPDSSATPPPIGAWSIRSSFFDDVGLEYAPGAPARPLVEEERRVGHWIVRSRRS